MSINNFKTVTILLTLCISLNTEAVLQKQILVKPSSVHLTELFDVFHTTGICKNDDSLNYRAKISGKVDFISAKEGSNVRKDELIIAIDQKLAESMLAKYHAAFHSAEIAYKRDKALFLKKIISDELLDKSLVLLETKKNELEDGLKIYNNMLITAPFDGKIGVIKVKVGEQINVGDELFTVIADSTQSIILEIPESIYADISKETEVKIIDSAGRSSKAKIQAISQYISDSGTIPIKAIIKNNEFIHGSFVKAELIINKHNGLTVPEQAVLKNDNGNFVYKIGTDNLVKQVYVKLGTRTNNLIEVISENINLGDRIVLEGLTKIQDGTLVKILD